MGKYIVIKKISILDSVILTEDDIIEFNEDGIFTAESKYGSINFKYDDIKTSLKEYVEDNNVNVEMILLDDENEIKDYRLQLDIKTSRKKAKEIQKYLQDTLKSFI